MPNDRDGWEVLGGAVVRRRQRLGLTQQDVTARGGPSTAKLRDIEGGRGQSSRPRTLKDLDAALDWPNGTSSAIAELMMPDWTTAETEVDQWIQTMVHLDAERPLPPVIRDAEVVTGEIDQIQGRAADELSETVAAVVSLLQLSSAKASRGDVEGAARATEQAAELMVELREGRAGQLAELTALVNERLGMPQGDPNERPPITQPGGTGAAEEISVTEFEAALRRRRLEDEQPDDMDPAEFPRFGAAARQGHVEPGEQDNDSRTDDYSE